MMYTAFKNMNSNNGNGFSPCIDMKVWCSCENANTAMKQCFLTSVVQNEYLSVISPVNPIQAVLYVTAERNLIILSCLTISFADI